MPASRDNFGIPKFEELSPDAQTFARRLLKLDLTANQVFGLFFMIGAYSSVSYDQEQLALNRKVTTNFGFYDENLTLDEMVGEYFISQDYLYAELIELIGIELDYRSIEIEGIEPFHILRQRGTSILPLDLRAPKNFADINKVYLAFYEAIGASIRENDIGLREAVMCGLFDLQILLQMDQKATAQFIAIHRQMLAPLLASINRLAMNAMPGEIDGYLDDQLTLIGFWPGQQDQVFMSVAWPFQSMIFYKDGVTLDHVADLDPQSFFDHCMVQGDILVTNHFSDVPKLSDTSISLDGLPIWGSAALNFQAIDRFIAETWGYQSDNLQNQTERLHYRGCQIHCVFSSIAKARETYN